MKKKLLMILFVLFYLNFIKSEESLDDVDQLDNEGKYIEALKILQESLTPGNINKAILWRIGRETFELGNKIKEKEARIKFYKTGENTLKPFLYDKKGSNRDQAETIHWYAANYSSRLKLMGIFGGKESLDIVPVIFKLMDDCLTLDPFYAPAYFFKAKLQEEVPSFLGGNKFLMGINYHKALLYADEKIKFFIKVEAAYAYYQRNWDINKIEKMAHKKNDLQEKLSFSTINDREYALQLLNEAITSYKLKEIPSFREKGQYQKALQFLKIITKK